MEKTQQAIVELPFHLRHLEDARVSYGLYSAKVGAGKQEIRLAGTGEVTLFLTMSRDAEPVVRTKAVSKDIVLRLLETFESEGFTSLDAEILGEEGDISTRVIELDAGDTRHSVTLVGAKDAQFERLVGAIKLAAAVAFPEVSRGTFFPHL